MQCAKCIAFDRQQQAICDACLKMRQESNWEWEIDTGNRLVRCPHCGHALPIPLWCYELPYRFCSWCGAEMVKSEQLKFDIIAKGE